MLIDLVIRKTTFGLWLSDLRLFNYHFSDFQGLEWSVIKQEKGSLTGSTPGELIYWFVMVIPHRSPRPSLFRILEGEISRLFPGAEAVIKLF